VSSGSPERLSARGRARPSQPDRRRDPVSGRRCRRAFEGEAFVAAPIVGSLIVVAAMALFVIVFRTSRNRPFRGATMHQSPPSPFEPIHGIVRQTDSPRAKRAQPMKSHAQTIENKR